MSLEAEFSKIKEISINLRNQIKSREITFIGSDSFPIGCCGNASDKLKNILIQKEFSGIEYVWGFQGEQSHGWLEYKGFIIDITADQFPEMKNQEVIIIKKDKSTFHANFEPF